MKWIYLILLIISLTIVGGISAFKINSIHYKNLANDRIHQVIDLQEADLSKAKIVYDQYDYFESGYVMEVYYDDDPDILYRYIFERPRDQVYVYASLGNASLDLTDRKGKYRYFFHTYFDRNGNIIEHE